MTYPTGDTASFVGLQRVIGNVGGKAGTFVLQTTGSYQDGVTRADWFVVPGTGTGTGDLAG
jgi:hypothetical protein